MILAGILKILSSIFGLRYSLQYADLICIWFWKYSVINRQFQCFKDRSVKQSCNLKNYIVKKCYTSEVFLHKISPNVISRLSKRQDIMKKSYSYLLLHLKQCHFQAKSKIFQGKDYMVNLCLKISCLWVQKINFSFKIPAKLRKVHKSLFSHNHLIYKCIFMKSKLKKNSPSNLRARGNSTMILKQHFFTNWISMNEVLMDNIVTQYLKNFCNKEFF